MKTTYNTKLTTEQKAKLKTHKKELANTGAKVVFIGSNTIAMVPTVYGKYYIGKATASKREQKVRAKVGMFYALERACYEKRTISHKVFDQIMGNAEYWESDTQRFYGDESFEAVRHL